MSERLRNRKKLNRPENALNTSHNITNNQFLKKSKFNY